MVSLWPITDANREAVEALAVNREVDTMWTSVGQGEGSPVAFYERYGFKRTGDFHGKEILLRLEIS